MERHARTENRGEYNVFVYHIAAGVHSQRSGHILLAIAQFLAYLICENLSEPLEVAAETQTVGLH